MTSKLYHVATLDNTLKGNFRVKDECEFLVIGGLKDIGKLKYPQNKKCHSEGGMALKNPGMTNPITEA